MLRRLFFLFPDESHAQNVVDQLIERGIPERRIHAIASGVELNTLPKATRRQLNDTAFRIVWMLWCINFLVFAAALLVLVTTLISGEVIWALAAFSVMLMSFIAGEQFVVNVPDVHINEFTDSLSYGEVLLLVDVARAQVAQVESFVHHTHPESALCGVSWSTDVFGL